MTIKKNSAEPPKRHANYAVANNPTLENRPMKTPQETSITQPVISPNTVDINFHCGCGFSTRVLSTAISHALEKKHSIEVGGWVRHLKHIAASKVEAIKESQAKFSKYDSDINELNMTAIHNGYDELKAKLLQISQT